QDAAETLQILANAKDKQVQQARLHMLEIANSARQPWVAYGDRYGNPALSPMARHFRWGFSIGVVSLQLGSVGRTEMGAYAPRSGLQRGQTAPPQIWSAQRLQLVAEAFGFTKRLNVLSLVEMDQLYAPFPRPEHQYYLLFSLPGWLKTILPGVGRVRDAMSDALQQYAPSPAQRLFWMSPYPHSASFSCTDEPGAHRRAGQRAGRGGPRHSRPAASRVWFGGADGCGGAEAEARRGAALRALGKYGVQARSEDRSGGANQVRRSPLAVRGSVAGHRPR